MSLTDAKRRSNNKYISEHMTVLGCKVRKTDADKYRAAAVQQGTNINAVLKQALENMINKENNTNE